MLPSLSISASAEPALVLYVTLSCICQMCSMCKRSAKAMRDMLRESRLHLLPFLGRSSGVLRLGVQDNLAPSERPMAVAPRLCSRSCRLLCLCRLHRLGFGVLGLLRILRRLVFGCLRTGLPVGAITRLPERLRQRGALGPEHSWCGVFECPAADGSHSSWRLGNAVAAKKQK
jgi:hypothetical protein